MVDVRVSAVVVIYPGHLPDPRNVTPQGLLGPPNHEALGHGAPTLLAGPTVTPAGNEAGFGPGAPLHGPVQGNEEGQLDDNSVYQTLPGPVAPPTLPLGLTFGNFAQMVEQGILDVPIEWTPADDRYLLHLVLQFARLTRSDMQLCCMLLGRDRSSVKRRWFQIRDSGDVVLRRRDPPNPDHTI